MSFWSKVKDKWKVGVGAVSLAVLGAAGGYWAYEKIGYEGNVHVFNERLNHVVYGGDGGLDTPQRAGIVKSIAAYAPKKVRLLGDLTYPIGTRSEADYIAHIAVPFGDFGPQHTETLLVMGNHGFYSAKESERHFLQKKFQSGPVGKVRFDNYYGMNVYYNACEIYYESTIYDVKVGDPDIQKRQEEFVCKAVNDPRCVGKTMIAITHQAAIGKGPRGNTKSGDYMSFDENCLRNKVDYVLSGHEHTTLYSGMYGRTQYFIAGALAKLTVGSPGYLTLDDGVVRERLVGVKAYLVEEDDH